MEKRRIIIILWNSVLRLFRRRGKVTEKENDANSGADQWADEAPLHTDGFSHYMRSLQGPFFE